MSWKLSLVLVPQPLKIHRNPPPIRIPFEDAKMAALQTPPPPRREKTQVSHELSDAMLALECLFCQKIIFSHFFRRRFEEQHIGVSKNNGIPKSSIFNKSFPLFSPSILGYP